MFKAVVFDLDGTLTDTLESLKKSGNNTLRHFGLEERRLDEYKYFAGNGPDELVRRILRASGDTELKYFEEAYKFYNDEFKKDSMYMVKPYEGILELVEILKTMGLKLAVLTNKNNERAKNVIENVFEEDTFEVVMGSQEGLKKKPDPEGAFKICEILDVKPEECLYLGDTNVDMETANSAGMYPVGVLWGFRQRNELIESGAKIIIERPMDLVDELL